MPEVSVILPVRNAAAYLPDALRSIQQQSFRDWELIVVDDASTDGSAEALQSFQDPRLVFLQNDRPRGVAFSLNRAIAAARGTFLARMDADDVSLPHRLAAQVEFLRGRPEVGVCGTWVTCFGRGRPFPMTWPTGSACVRSYLLFDNPFAHPTVCLRASFLKQAGLTYNEDLQAAQDFDLWCRCADRTQLDNLPRVLLRYRLHAESVSQTRQEVSDQTATALLRRQLGLLGIDPDPAGLRFHRRVGHGAGMRDGDELRRAEQWLAFIREQNRQRRVLDEEGLAEAAAFVWWRVCLNSAGLGPRVRSAFFASDLSPRYAPLRQERIALLIRSWQAKVRGPGAPAGHLAVWDRHGGDAG